ncbi:class I SAM-dependent methyltransferase [Azospirillum sp. TSO5]|uniref:class I SAM-dependent methyltransferase n=1 Tax=Azospirillum sp. TSO5 TaxID=716760 RepID=UPI000D651F6F|nr:class I SAM-dependent methyltransferase [Azospirillum sp. TSO5]
MKVAACHLCGQDALIEVEAFRRFRRITSDFRPWPSDGRLAVCSACGAAQKMATEAWRQDCHAIYASYDVYPQGDGSEQVVFASSGAGEARSRVILRRLIDEHRLPETGWHLDFGCGDGSLLRNAAAVLPGWWRAGAEINESRRPEIEAIDGVREFYAGNIAAIPTRFDLVTTVHVLEHFEQPATIAAMLAGKLAAGGLLMIQTPDLLNNPFDLLIADHATHFTPAVMRQCLAKAGLAPLALTADWTPRELSVVARRAEVGATEAGADSAMTLALVESHLDWLDRLVETARQAASTQPIGLFGTSIAASWLFGEVSAETAFFVDEDDARVGSTYHGRSVFHPTQVPPGSRVLIAHTPVFAETVIERLLAYGHFDVVMPPPFD